MLTDPLNRIYAICRITVSFIWFYHGLVPKLLFKHVDEYTPLWAAGFSDLSAEWMVRMAGIAEIGMAIALLLFWRARSLFWVTIGLMGVALIGVAAASPRMLYAAFNPVSLNLSMMALSAIGLLIH